MSDDSVNEWTSKIINEKLGILPLQAKNLVGDALWFLDEGQSLTDGLIQLQLDGTFAVDTKLRAVAVGNLNEDKLENLDAFSIGNNNVSILKRRGNDSITSQVIFNTGIMEEFNENNPKELVLTNPDGDDGDTLSLLLKEENTDATGAVTFAPQVMFSAGDKPFALALGDVNSDGHQDILVVNNKSDDVSVLLGDGSGNFSTQSPIPVGFGPRSIAIGDFNNDDNLDAVVANFGLPGSPFFNNTISVLLGNGSGNFSVQAPITVGVGPHSIAVEDFNRDGYQDVVTANWDDDTLSVLWGNGKGNFSLQSTLPVGQTPSFLVVEDFNQDGWPDLVNTNMESDNISILLGDGSGNFLPQTLIPVGNFPRSVASGDFNNDNLQDLVVVNRDDKNVQILLGNGDGTFWDRGTFPVGNGSRIADVENLSGGDLEGQGPRVVTVEDLNGDGWEDLAVTNIDEDNVSVLIGHGDGSFAPQVTFSTGDSPNYVAVGDFNEDNLMDLVVTNRDGNNLSILLNTSESPQIVIEGTPSNDRLIGSDADEILLGFDGNDLLVGGDGDDILDGGRGNDRLRGNFGTDQYVLREGDGMEIILDFADGEDFFLLVDGLTFSDLSVSSSSIIGDALIQIHGSNESLARVVGINASQLTAADFVVGV